MATPNGGAFAEYVAVHPAQLRAVPDNVPLEVMLAYPVNMRTAYYMVYVWAKVQEGERVLLHAAAGGRVDALAAVLPAHPVAGRRVASEHFLDHPGAGAPGR